MTASEILNGMAEIVGKNSDTNLIVLYDGIQIIKEYSSIILGILVVLIAAFTPIIVALEVMYLNFPTFHDLALKYTDKNNEKLVAKSLTLILRDANRALRESYVSGESANAIYLKLKLKTIILMVLVVGIVIGPLQMIVWFLADLIVDIVTSLIS